MADIDVPSSVQVKISGDGTSFSKHSNYFLFSFSFPFICKDVLTGSGNHTFAVVKCVEDYDSLQANFGPVLSEMNQLIEEKEIVIDDGTVIQLDLILGGDMKFVLNILGMNAAHANYSCIWCDIHKKERSINH